MPASDPADRRLIARLGGLTTASRHTGQEMTAPARKGRWESLLRQVDEECPGLPEYERQRRAGCLLNLHMTKISREGVKARRRKAKRRVTTEAKRRDVYEQAWADGAPHDQAEEIAEEATWEETPDAT